ncbi:MAG: VOC family protein [Rhizomicrobium sp.]
MTKRTLYHVSLGVSDMARARSFYIATLSALGSRLLCEFKNDAGDIVLLGFGKLFPELWVNRPLDGGKTVSSNGAHVALFAQDATAVQVFHQAGLAAGGTDDGAPGCRLEYQPGYYAAFLRDPDGNKMEAVWLDQSKKDNAL